MQQLIAIRRQPNRYHHLAPAISALMISAVVTACSQDVMSPTRDLARVRSVGIVADSQQVALQAADERSAAAQGRQLRGIEDDILRLEGVLPGLGGLFIDSTGIMAVYAPTSAKPDSVRTILARHDSLLHLREPFARQVSSGNQVHVLAGQYPFSYLVVWARMFSTQLAPGDGIVSIDADESHNRVSIGISDTGATSKVLQTARSIGIPAAAIRMTVTAPAKLQSTLQDAFSTRVGGIQIWTSGVYGGTCTLGFDATTSTGITGFITASHCAPSSSLGSGATGATVYQNGSSYPVGTIVTNPVWNIVDPSCGTYSGVRCTYADVMMVKYNTGIANQKWVMYTTSVGTGGSSGSITTAGTYQVNATTFYPVTGDVVDKMGRTTGWTRGPIANTCQTVTVYDPSTAQYGVVLCSNSVTAHSDAGDSGGPVFNQQFGLTYAYGLLFAGSGTTYYFEGFQAMQRMLGYTPVVY